MHLIPLLSSLVLLVPSSLALSQGRSCILTSAIVRDIVDKSVIFLQHEDIEESRAIGTELYAPEAVQYGDSINLLRGDPPGTVVYPNATAYIEGTLTAPGIPEIEVLAIYNDCTSFVWLWEFNGIGGPNAPVKNRIRGTTYAEVNGYGKITQQNVEFNSLAWAANTGFNISFPDSGTYADAPPDARRVKRSF